MSVYVFAEVEGMKEWREGEIEGGMDGWMDGWMKRANEINNITEIFEMSLPSFPDVIQKYLVRDIKLVGLAIAALRNLMLDVSINRGKVAEGDGLLILTHVYFTCTDTNVKQQCLGALKNLVGNSW